MKNNILPIILLTFLVTACSESREGPSEEQVQNAFILGASDRGRDQMDSFGFDDTTIEVSENIGSKVEPIYHARFSMKLHLKENLYESVDQLMDKSVLKITSSEDSQYTISGTYKATPQGESWKVKFERPDISPEPSGRPLTKWQPDQYVFSGSDEETELRKEAEERRIAAEEKRITEEKAAEEKRITEEKAAEENRIALSKAKESRRKEDKESLAAFMGAKKLANKVITTKSGLKYIINEEGIGKKPAGSTSTVTAHYIGRLTDGTEFDNSYRRGIPAIFTLNQVIPGWKEGLQLMNAGSKYTFFMPSALAYGSDGTPSIPPNASLLFKIELISFED